MTHFLTRPGTLWILFGLFIIETICFGVVMAVWDFTIIDEMSDPAEITQHIAHMTEPQRTAHAWMTATLDVAYPLTYGALFAGLSLRALPSLFALPAWAVIPTDLAEGVAQVLLLTGDDTLLWLKAFLTPMKLGLFILAALIAIAALIIDLRKRRRGGLSG